MADLEHVEKLWQRHLDGYTDESMHLMTDIARKALEERDRLTAEVDQLKSLEDFWAQVGTEPIRGNIARQEKITALRADVEKWRIAEGEAMLVVESQDLRLEKLQADLAEAQRERLNTVGICEEEVKDVRAENERLRKALDNWAYLQTKLEAAVNAMEAHDE